MPYFALTQIAGMLLAVGTTELGRSWPKGGGPMMNIRQVERNWEARRYHEIVADLLATRVESLMLPRLLAGDGIGAGLGVGVAAAASAVIRLDELGLPDRPLCAKLL